MLNNKRLIFSATSTAEEKEIAKHIASIDVETLEVSFNHQYLDKEACKDHREELRKDHAEFEDWMYELQEKLK